MNRSPWLLLAFALVGASAAPTPLVAGSVRDTAGRAIAGATVWATDDAGRTVSTSTADDGTFALEASGVRVVRVGCRFCQTTSAGVGPDGIAIVVVKRYDALAFSGPTSDDLADLPYARVESALSLTPFTVLENSRSPVPGPQLSDRVVSNGGLVVDAGIPQYDIVTGASPFLVVPDRYVQSASVLPQSDGYAYGGLAEDGTYSLDPSAEGDDANAAVGAGASARAGAERGAFAASAGGSSDAAAQRRRIDASFSPSSGTFVLSALASDADTSYGDASGAGASFVGVRASAQRTQTFTTRVDAYADRGTYDASYESLQSASAWSDVGGTVLVHSNAAVAPFASFGIRNSAGSYAAPPGGGPSFAATLTQAQEIVGVRAANAIVDATAAFGGYNLAYSGGAYGRNLGATAYAATPLVRVRLTPVRHWSLEVSSTGGFRLPDFAQRYGSGGLPNFTAFDRDATDETTFEYTDDARVRVDATALVRNTTGFDTGRAASLGGSVAWQVVPTISLRAWWMHVTPNERIYGYGSRVLYPQGASVGSLWLTYANASNLSVNVVWRQDLLNYRPYAQLDASIAGPLAPRLRWYVGTERPLGVGELEAGLRFTGN